MLGVRRLRSRLALSFCCVALLSGATYSSFRLPDANRQILGRQAPKLAAWLGWGSFRCTRAADTLAPECILFGSLTVQSVMEWNENNSTSLGCQTPQTLCTTTERYTVVRNACVGCTWICNGGCRCIVCLHIDCKRMSLSLKSLSVIRYITPLSLMHGRLLLTTHTLTTQWEFWRTRASAPKPPIYFVCSNSSSVYRRERGYIL